MSNYLPPMQDLACNGIPVDLMPYVQCVMCCQMKKLFSMLFCLVMLPMMFNLLGKMFFISITGTDRKSVV